MEIPDKAMKALGEEARPAIAISINGHNWRSRVAVKIGKRLIGISAANRAASGICAGNAVEIDVTLDREPRTVELPDDLAAALNNLARIRSDFEELPFGLRHKYVREIEDAKSAETRSRRIAKLTVSLKAGSS